MYFHCEYKTNNIILSLYLYKNLSIDRLLIYDFNGTIYIYMRVLKILLSYYFIDLCYILHRPKLSKIY